MHLLSCNHDIGCTHAGVFSGRIFVWMFVFVHSCFMMGYHILKPSILCISIYYVGECVIKENANVN